MACKCNQPSIQSGRIEPTGHVDCLLTALGHEPDRSRPGIYPADDLRLQRTPGNCSCGGSTSCGCADCQTRSSLSHQCTCVDKQTSSLIWQKPPSAEPSLRYPFERSSPGDKGIASLRSAPSRFDMEPPPLTPDPGVSESQFSKWLETYYPSQYQALMQCGPKVEVGLKPPIARQPPSRVLPGIGPDVPVAPGLSFVHPLWDPLRGLAIQPLASARLVKQLAPTETLAAQGIASTLASVESARKMMPQPAQAANMNTQAIVREAMLPSTPNTNAPNEQFHATTPSGSVSRVASSISKIGVSSTMQSRAVSEITGNTSHAALSGQTRFEPNYLTVSSNSARRKDIQSTLEPAQLRSARTARQPIAVSHSNGIYFSSGGGASACAPPTASITVGAPETGFAVTGQAVTQPRWATTKMQGGTIVLNAFWPQYMQPWKVGAVVGLVWESMTAWDGRTPFPNYLSTFYRSLRGQIMEIDQVHQLLTVKLDLTTRDASRLKEVNEYTLVADDSVAIQAALDWAHAQGGATVHIPAGTYTIGVPHTNNMVPAYNDNDLSLSQCTPESTDLEAAFRCAFNKPLRVYSHTIVRGEGVGESVLKLADHVFQISGQRMRTAYLFGNGDASIFVNAGNSGVLSFYGVKTDEAEPGCFPESFFPPTDECIEIADMTLDGNKDGQPFLYTGGGNDDFWQVMGGKNSLIARWPDPRTYPKDANLPDGDLVASGEYRYAVTITFTGPWGTSTVAGFTAPIGVGQSSTQPLIIDLPIYSDIWPITGVNVYIAVGTSGESNKDPDMYYKAVSGYDAPAVFDVENRRIVLRKMPPTDSSLSSPFYAKAVPLGLGRTYLAEGQTSSGLSLANVDKAYCHDLDIRDFALDGMEVSGGAAKRIGSTCVPAGVVTNSLFERIRSHGCGRWSLGFPDKIENLVFRDCSFCDSGGAVDFEGPPESSNLSFQRCVFSGPGFLVSLKPAQGETLTSVSFVECIFWGGTGPHIDMKTSDPEPDNTTPCVSGFTATRCVFAHSMQNMIVIGNAGSGKFSECVFWQPGRLFGPPDWIRAAFCKASAIGFPTAQPRPRDWTIENCYFRMLPERVCASPENMAGAIWLSAMDPLPPGTPDDPFSVIRIASNTYDGALPIPSPFVKAQVRTDVEVTGNRILGQGCEVIWEVDGGCELDGCTGGGAVSCNTPPAACPPRPMVGVCLDSGEPSPFAKDM